VCYNYGIVIQEVPLETSVDNIDRRVTERDSCNLHIDIYVSLSTVSAFGLLPFLLFSLSLRHWPIFFMYSFLNTKQTNNNSSIVIRIVSNTLSMTYYESDQCRITPSPPPPPKKKKGRRRRKEFFFLISMYVWVGFDTTDWLSGIFIWWSCKNHHDHPPHQIRERESPRRRSLKCQVCDWLIVKGSKDTYILTSLNDGPLRSLMLPFETTYGNSNDLFSTNERRHFAALVPFWLLSFFFKTLNRWVLTHTLL